MRDSSLREGKCYVREEKVFVSSRLPFSLGELEKKKYFSKSKGEQYFLAFFVKKIGPMKCVKA